MLFWFVVYDVWKCFVSTTHISVLFHYFSHWAFVDRLGDRKPLFDFIVYLWKTPVRNLWLYLWYPVIVWTTYYRARRVNMTLLILRDACARAPMKARLLFLSFPFPFLCETATDLKGPTLGFCRERCTFFSRLYFPWMHTDRLSIYYFYLCIRRYTTSATPGRSPAHAASTVC